MFAGFFEATPKDGGIAKQSPGEIKEETVRGILKKLTKKFPKEYTENSERS